MVLLPGEGQNPARQTSINAGVPAETPAWVVNQLCASGLRAVALGYQQIRAGDASVVVAGGQESMSKVGGGEDNGGISVSPENVNHQHDQSRGD